MVGNGFGGVGEGRAVRVKVPTFTTTSFSTETHKTTKLDRSAVFSYFVSPLWQPQIVVASGPVKRGPFSQASAEHSSSALHMQRVVDLLLRKYVVSKSIVLVFRCLIRRDMGGGWENVWWVWGWYEAREMRMPERGEERSRRAKQFHH